MNGNMIGQRSHFSASNEEAFSSSAISRELSNILPDQMATNSNPEGHRNLSDYHETL